MCVRSHLRDVCVGIEPEDRLLYSAPGIQDNLMSCLATGAIELVRDSIAELADKNVKLAGGRVLEDIEYVFLATGYNVRTELLVTLKY